MESFVKCSIEGGVGVVTLARPEKRNALKRSFIEQLSAAIDELTSDATLRVLLLSAEGNVFCAGMDLGEMQERAQSENGSAEWQEDSRVYAELLKKLFQLDVPTVVALQGPVLAGGVGMVLACDFIVASDTSFLMLPEPMRGITAAMVTPLLVFRCGAGVATQLLLSGEKFGAARCVELGLAYRAAPADQLNQTVESLIASILTGAKNALAITKQHVRQCGGSHIESQLTDSISVSARARETNDAREGLAAFLEKRKPAWQNS
ncbi:MAG: enoyl-CoA hydratase-related protein [Planctomycetota bacterium]